MDYALETNIGGDGMTGRGTMDYIIEQKLHDVPDETVLEIISQLRSIGGYSIRREGAPRVDEVTLRRGKES